MTLAGTRPARLGRRGLWALFAVAAAVLVAAHAWGVDHLRMGKPKNIGNRRENVEALAALPASPSYRFAVIGDPEDGIAVFEKCLVRARERGCAFAVICGDLVHRPDEAAYDFFLYEFREIGFSGPVFAVIGNHDGRRDDDHLFRREIGPPNFSFSFRDDLFVLVDNARGMTEESVAYLEGTLRKRRAGARRAFVFAHCPFFDVSREGTELESAPNEGSAAAERVFARERVDAVFAGHLHSYRREVREGVLHVVTGGAGGRLQERDAFPHYVEVEVGPEGVQDSAVRVAFPSAGERFDQAAERVLFRYAFLTLWTKPGLYALLLLPIGLYFLQRRRGLRLRSA